MGHFRWKQSQAQRTQPLQEHYRYQIMNTMGKLSDPFPTIEMLHLNRKWPISSSKMLQMHVWKITWNLRSSSDRLVSPASRRLLKLLTLQLSCYNRTSSTLVQLQYWSFKAPSWDMSMGCKRKFRHNKVQGYCYPSLWLFTTGERHKAKSHILKLLWFWWINDFTLHGHYMTLVNFSTMVMKTKHDI